MADLTTLANVKQYMNLSSIGDDALLSNLITRTSLMIENFIDRSVLAGARSEVRDGHGNRRMFLSDSPVTAASSVVVDGVSIPAAATSTANGYRIVQNSIVLNGYTFTVGYANVSISYTAGYAAVPSDIEQACIETVALAYKRKDHVDVSSKSLGGETISFITSDLTPSARTSLFSYKRVTPL